MKQCTTLCLLLERIGEAAHVLLEVALVTEELDVGAVNLDTTLLALSDVLLAAERSETPVLRDDDLLATRELVLGATESLDGGGAVSIPRPHGEDDLANVDTSDSAVGLAESTTHTGLKSIGSGARQHLVDADDVVGVSADTEMETFLAGNLDEVLIGANTGGFQRFRAQLFIFVGDKVDAEREFVNVGPLATKIEDTDLGVWHTTVES